MCYSITSCLILSASESVTNIFTSILYDTSGKCNYFFLDHEEALFKVDCSRFYSDINNYIEVVTTADENRDVDLQNGPDEFFPVLHDITYSGTLTLSPSFITIKGSDVNTAHQITATLTDGDKTDTCEFQIAVKGKLKRDNNQSCELKLYIKHTQVS